MKENKLALLKSALSLLLCFVLLMTTTLAWFMDKVSSKQNIIKSGNLDLEMYWTDNLDSGVWHNVEDENYNTIFSEQNWEPGYTVVKYIKLVNAGKLALNYKLSIDSQSGVGKLAEVINVYYANNSVKVESRNDLNKLNTIGLLDNIINGGATADGTLLAKDQQSPLHKSGETIITVAMSMITTAGNEYENQRTGNFTINAIATQAPFEEDSFGTNYDDNAEYPVIIKDNSVTVDVAPVDSKVPVGGVTISGNGVSAFIPEGTLLKEGVNKLSLIVTPLKSTTSDITVVNGEILIPVDVHIEGIAEDNTVPSIIDLGEVLPKYLNMGNYHLFHVEDGQNKVMTLVDDKASLNAHNQFTYDSDTGAISVAMASFSEVAMIADTANKWNGKYSEADSDFNGSGTEADPYIISKADELAGLSELISSDNDDEDESNNWGNKYYKLINNINIGTENIWYPIGYRKLGTGANSAGENTWYTYGGALNGVFDGAGHTITGIYQNTWSLDGDYDYGYWDAAMGLFGYVYGGTVKNLTVDNFSSDGEFTPTGVIAAYAADATFENIAITNCNPRVYNTGNGGIVGVGGNSADTSDKTMTFTNITVDKTNKISALWGSWDVACGGIMGMFRGYSNVNFTNCHVAAQIDVFNDVCGNYQYYWYRYAGMMIGSLRGRNTTDADGYTVPNLSGIKATGCTVRFDEWNDYYYCELVANSLASYTHDHQFSRLEEIYSIDVAKKEYQPTEDSDFIDIPTSGRYNYVIVTDTETPSTEEAECYHFVNGVQHFHDVADNDNKEIYETVNGVQTLKENNAHIYLPFNQIFQGDGWGVKHIAIAAEEDSNLKDQGYEDLDIKVLARNGASIEKFIKKFDGDFLYRVGNANEISLNTLFAATDAKDNKGNTIEINDSSVVVAIDKLDENMNVSATYTADTNNWENGKIKFTGTGVMKITIQDYNYCKPTVLYVEVVDAYNATSAVSAPYKYNNVNYNVVLLKDISSGFSVSGNYTFYGNGFTLNYTGNGQYLNNGLRQGVVSISENGTLDNLHVNASIYPRTYLYYGATVLGDYVQNGPFSQEGDKKRYHYQLSAVAASDSATISNCYIYGGRNNIYINTGDVTVKDTVLENGTVANLQIQSTDNHIVTLENITTIQNQVNPTIDNENQVMLGAGIIVGPDCSTNPKIILNGKFKQYNWVNADDKANVTNETAQMIIDAALNATEFNHTVNGKTASNLGIIYLGEFEVEQINNNIKNNTGLPYEAATVSMKYGVNSAKGVAYSLKGATAEQICSDISAAERNTTQGDYIPTFNFDLGNQALSYDGSEDNRYLYGDKNGVTALYQDGEAALTLDLTKIASFYKYKGFNYDYTAVCKDSADKPLTETNGVVTLSAQGNYILEFTVTDNIFYDKDGIRIDKTVERTFTVPLALTVKAAAIKNAVVNIKNTALNGTYKTVNLTDYELQIKFLDCISVTDYDNEGTGTEVNLSSNIASATLTPSGVNVFTTASTITITYDDGRILTVNLSKISGSSPGTKTAKVNTSGSVYFTTEGALNNKPTATSDQNKCTITSVSFKGNSGSTVTNDTDVTVTWALGSGGGGCVTPDTLVTLADGSQKEIQDVTYADNLLVWDFYKGEYTVIPSSIIMNHGYAEYDVVTLNFDDGTSVNTINGHGFFSVNENKFVIITKENVEQYIGNAFVKDAKNQTTTKLVSYSVKNEYTESWSILTAVYYNCILEGMLTLTPAEVEGSPEYLMPYEIEDMKYLQTDMQEDIEKYGLYTYEEFAEYITKEQFDALGLANFKVSVGKGYINWEEILYLLNLHMS